MDTVPPAGTRDIGPRGDAQTIDGHSPDIPVRGPNPRFPTADIEVRLPFRGPAQIVSRRVGAENGKLDVHFNIDTTGSFGEEIAALQRGLNGLIIPQLRDRVDDVAFGVSHFEDFPADPFGANGDRPFELFAPITTDSAVLGRSILALSSLGNGGDIPESGYESIYQVATGEGYTLRGRTYISDGPRGIGGVGFREGALPVIVHATDAPSHNARDYDRSFPRTHGLSEAAEALLAIDGRIIGIVSGDTARPGAEALAIETGSVTEPNDGVCSTGIGGRERPPTRGVCPLVFSVGPDGSGLSTAIVTALIDLLDSIAFDEVFGEIQDDPFGFVRLVKPTGWDTDGVEPTFGDLRPEDGIDDTFLDVHFGTQLDFDLVLQNTTLPGADYDQVFRLVVNIVGDRRLLDSLTIRVVVPAQPRASDAGTDTDILDASTVDTSVQDGAGD